MTPFMLAVTEQLDGEPTAPPETEPASEVSVAEGADTQVIIRSLAEQLISEANAVLVSYGEGGLPTIGLVDETGPGALAFTMSYRDRSARVQTVISGHSATAQLVVGGDEATRPRRLAGEDQLQALVLELIAS